MPGSKRRLAAIMFTDIVGFTSLSSKNEEMALSLIDKQRELLLPVVKEFQGEWLKEMGDGLLICFTSSINAVKCAIKIQKKSQLIPELNLRIGIHQGDIFEKGGDIFGDDVNIASRIEPFSAAGGVAISEKVAADLSGSPEFKLKYLGIPSLKGVTQKLKVFCIISHGLPETKASEIHAKLDKPQSFKWIYLATTILFASLVYFFIPFEPHSIDTIAVLPLEGTIENSDQDYFINGMTESLITELSKIKSIKVISSKAVKKFKNSDLSLEEIANKLHVGAIVEGSVFIDEGRVRISAQLTDATNYQNIWAEKYERDLSNILILQSEVALAIAKAIKATVTPEENSRIATETTVDPIQYDKFLKGMAFLDKMTIPSIENSILIFNEILQADSSYFSAYDGLARAYLSKFYLTGKQDYMNTFQTYAKKLLDYDQKSSKIYFLLGEISFYIDRNLEKAGEFYKRSIQLNPNSEETLNSYGNYLSTIGEFDKSISMYERATIINPLSHFSSCNINFVYLTAERYPEAIQKAEQSKGQFGSSCQMEDLVIATAHNQLGKSDMALDIITHKEDEEEINIRLLVEKGYTFGLLRKVDSARSVINQLEILEKNHRRKFPYFKAIVYAGIGETDQALELLQESKNMNEIWMLWLKVDFHFKELRNNDSFQNLI